jgi:hypothetical protein
MKAYVFQRLAPAATQQNATIASPARSFLEQATQEADPIRFLRDLVTNQAEGTDWFDFKGAARIKDGDLERHWGKALAGLPIHPSSYRSV